MPKEAVCASEPLKSSGHAWALERIDAESPDALHGTSLVLAPLDCLDQLRVASLEIDRVDEDGTPAGPGLRPHRAYVVVADRLYLGAVTARTAASIAGRCRSAENRGEDRVDASTDGRGRRVGIPRGGTLHDGLALGFFEALVETSCAGKGIEELTGLDLRRPNAGQTLRISARRDLLLGSAATVGNDFGGVLHDVGGFAPRHERRTIVLRNRGGEVCLPTDVLVADLHARNTVFGHEGKRREIQVLPFALHEKPGLPVVARLQHDFVDASIGTGAIAETVAFPNRLPARLPITGLPRRNRGLVDFLHRRFFGTSPETNGRGRRRERIAELGRRGVFPAGPAKQKRVLRVLGGVFDLEQARLGADHVLALAFAPIGDPAGGSRRGLADHQWGRNPGAARARTRAAGAEASFVVDRGRDSVVVLDSGVDDDPIFVVVLERYRRLEPHVVANVAVVGRSQVEGHGLVRFVAQLDERRGLAAGDAVAEQNANAEVRRALARVDGERVLPLIRHEGDQRVLIEIVVELESLPYDLPVSLDQLGEMGQRPGRALVVDVGSEPGVALPGGPVLLEGGRPLERDGRFHRRSCPLRAWPHSPSSRCRSGTPQPDPSTAPRPAYPATRSRR